jgi:thiol-disulfide isomerase/thioredoxin
MRVLSWSLGCCLLALFLYPAAHVQAAELDKETQAIADKIQVVKYKGLGDLVKKYKGKVVVVDFWNTSCNPCIQKGIPHLIQMQKTFGTDNLVILSVDLDAADTEAKQKKVKEDMAKIFKEKGATKFIAVILDEDPDEVLAKKLRIAAVPTMYVFNQAGKWTLFSEELDKYQKVDEKKRLDTILADIEALVKKLLKK